MHHIPARQRVLLADDDLVARLALEEVLHACAPVQVRSVEDGPAAWAALCGDDCFDLVCLDVRMPPPDGLELVARARAATALRRVPLMLVTATAERASVQAVCQHDLQGFLVKPVGPETVERLARVLAALDESILEPAPSACARLGIAAERHGRYVHGLGQQLATLQALAHEFLAHADAQVAIRFGTLAQGCRSAALTLGAPRIEQVVGDAVAALQSGRDDAARALGQARYWLGRMQQPA